MPPAPGLGPPRRSPRPGEPSCPRPRPRCRDLVWQAMLMLPQFAPLAKWEWVAWHHRAGDPDLRARRNPDDSLCAHARPQAEPCALWRLGSLRTGTGRSAGPGALPVPALLEAGVAFPETSRPFCGGSTALFLTKEETEAQGDEGSSWTPWLVCSRIAVPRGPAHWRGTL